MINARELRDSLLPFPDSDEYHKVLLLGTTGSGKSTLLRQLIGGHSRESFPTTSTARTTIADTEIILAPGPFKAAVTFFDREYIREQVVECIQETVVAAYKGATIADLQSTLLEHPDQRFRFKYTLGEGPASDEDDDLFGDFPATTSPASADQSLKMPELGELNLDATNQLIRTVVDLVAERVKEISAKLTDHISAEDSDDPRSVDERVGEALEDTVREDDALMNLADALLDSMVDRIDLLTDGFLTFADVPEGQSEPTEWPESWVYQTPERDQLIKQLKRFTSIAKAGWGRLLTPIVSGVRVSGPFEPAWNDGQDLPLILLDTEGLGHVHSSSSSIPVKVSRQIAEADAVVLVDNAQQPMQAAPAALLQAIARGGYARKLFLCFTHFDLVTGENLPTLTDRQKHVAKSCNGVIRSIRQELGHAAAGPLIARMRTGMYFLGALQDRLNADDHFDAVQPLQQLVKALTTSSGRPTLAETRPVYDESNAILAVRGAVDRFHHEWKAILGLGTAQYIEKAHWAQIKAMTRRLAAGTDTEFKGLRPIADLHRALVSELSKMIQNPIGWNAGEPSDKDAHNLYDDFSQELALNLLDLVHESLYVTRSDDWETAFWFNGTGSTIVRAHYIARDIFEAAAPTPGVVPSADKDAFLTAVRDKLRATANELSIKLR